MRAPVAPAAGAPGRPPPAGRTTSASFVLWATPAPAAAPTTPPMMVPVLFPPTIPPSTAPAAAPAPPLPPPPPPPPPDAGPRPRRAGRHHHAPGRVGHVLHDGRGERVPVLGAARGDRVGDAEVQAGPRRPGGAPR